MRNQPYFASSQRKTFVYFSQESVPQNSEDVCARELLVFSQPSEVRSMGKRCRSLKGERVEARENSIV